MSNNSDHIEQLTTTMMQQYLDGKLSSEMQYKVERYLIDHPFEAEAMEGFDEVSVTHLDSDIEQLKKELFVEKKETKTFPIWLEYWKVAAVVTVLLVSAFLMLNLGDQPNSDLALNDEPSAAEESGNMSNKEEEDEPVETQEILTEAATHDVISQHEIEQLSIADLKEDFLAHADDVEKEEEGNEVQVMSEMTQLNQSEVLITGKTTNKKNVKTFSMIEPDELAKETVVVDDMVVKGEGVNITNQLDGGIVEVSLTEQRRINKDDFSKEKIVRGKITSAEDGSLLPGVNVVITGTTTGTISDIDGNYEIIVPEENEVSLSYSFIGYTSEEVQVGGRSTIDPILSSDVSQFSEIVVGAYGVERENNSSRYASSNKKTIRKQNAKPLIGFEAYNNYLQDSLVYPQDAIDYQIIGKVRLELSIDQAGLISNVVVKESLGYGCDEEAIRLIQEGPAWQPAIKRGELIQEKVKLEVVFEN